MRMRRKPTLREQLQECRGAEQRLRTRNGRLEKLLWDGIHIMPAAYGQKPYDGKESWDASVRAELGEEKASDVSDRH